MSRTAIHAAIATLGLGLSVSALASPQLLYTNTLDPLLADPRSNFHPQGLGYDTSADELLFAQQSVSGIVRTDLQGNVLGTHDITSMTFRPEGNTTNRANHVTSVAGDAGRYYISDYTNNAGGYDFYGVDKSTGVATTLSSERAAYGGYPIDVRNGMVYRTEPSTTYNWANLDTIRISALADVDTILGTVTLAGAYGIGDIAVDADRNQVWTIDYSASALLRQFDLGSGVQLGAWNLGMDGLNAGITYAAGVLYYYDWMSGSGSTLSAYRVDSGTGGDIGAPGPATLGLAGLGLLALRRVRRSQR